MFKTGDVVRCIDDNSVDNLTLGGKYIIFEAEDQGAIDKLWRGDQCMLLVSHMDDAGCVVWHFASRFESVLDD